MSYEIIGKLTAKYDIVQRTETFKTREFVVEKTDDFNGHTDAPCGRVARQPAVAGRKCQFWKGGRA